MLRKSMVVVSMTLAVMGLAACGDNDNDETGQVVATPTPAPTSTPIGTVTVGDTLVLTASGTLASFNRAAPNVPVGAIGIRGVNGGETLLGIDYRQANGLLYALGSDGGVYTVEPTTGVATLRTTLKAAAGDDNPYTALTGTDFGIDFNPAADRLRVVSDTGQNLRINVDTGDTTTDGDITPAAGSATITAVAYTNAFAGTTSTTLFDIDAGRGLLHVQDPPNNGGLTAGVSLGLPGPATGVNGFDIDARNNIGYAVLTVNGNTALCTINLAATEAAVTVVSDITSGEDLRGLTLVQPAAPTVLGLTTDDELVSFDPKAPNTLTATVAITGLADGENVVGIDVRPSDRALYALTSAGVVYTIDATTGAATLKSTLAADAADTTAPFTALAGTVFSVDFNPAADRLRVISDTGQSLRINVDTGNTTTDGDINRAGAAPSVVAAAYTNNFAGTGGTLLLNLEANSDVLTRQDPPNNGTLVDVGPLGLDISEAGGFDIAGGANGLALAALRTAPSGPYSLYGVALATGAATLYRNTGDAALSRIGGDSGPDLRDLAIRF